MTKQLSFVLKSSMALQGEICTNLTWVEPNRRYLETQHYAHDFTVLRSIRDHKDPFLDTESIRDAIKVTIVGDVPAWALSMNYTWPSPLQAQPHAYLYTTCTVRSHGKGRPMGSEDIAEWHRVFSKRDTQGLRLYFRAHRFGRYRAALPEHAIVLS